MTDRFKLGVLAAGAVASLGALAPTLATASPPQGVSATKAHGSASAAAHGSASASTHRGGSAAGHGSGSGGRSGSGPGPAALPCPSIALSQPFLAWGDKGEYALLRGEDPDNFDGSGWKLNGGARVMDVRLHDGGTGQVLDLPAGASVVSPAICVSPAYPKARTLVRDLAGSQGVHIYVSFYKNGAWGRSFSNGMVKGLHGNWAASVPIMIHAASLKSLTPARFTLVAGGSRSEYQLYNFYVDPRLIK